MADRFVRGTCPNPGCGCGRSAGRQLQQVWDTTTAPVELVDPVSTLSGATPEVAARHCTCSSNWSNCTASWTIGPNSGEHLQPEVANYLRGHFLHEPAARLGYFAPCAVLWLRDSRLARQLLVRVVRCADRLHGSQRKQWCDRRTARSFDDWWPEIDDGDGREIHHFIGKDITYFHTLFWPGMLKTAGFSLPTKVHIHGFLTVDGEKMSKSKGTFVAARTYLAHLDPAYLRYFYASKLSSKVDDIDLSIDEFIAKVNTDLVGKVVNLASRSAKFVAKTGLSKEYPDDGGLFAQAAQAGEEIAQAYEACDYSKAMRLIMQLADRANPFVEENKPWELRKDESQADRLQNVCTVALNLFRQLAIYLAPVLPKLAEQSGELLNDPITSWDQAQTPLVGTQVNKFKHMLKRVEEKKVNAMIEDSKQETGEPGASATGENTDFVDQWNDPGDSLAAEPLADECTFDDFTKVDLRVVRVVEAEQVPEARKLLKLKLSLGGGEYRQVFAGIKAAYDPEKLVGRLVVMVANLAPRQMKFGLSEGMVVASGPGGEEVFVLSPDEGAKVGQRVH